MAASAFQRIGRIAVEESAGEINSVDGFHVVAVHDLKVVANLCRYFMQLFYSVSPSGNTLASLCVDMLFAHVPAFFLSLGPESEKGLPCTDVESTGTFNIGDLHTIFCPAVIELFF